MVARSSLAVSWPSRVIRPSAGASSPASSFSNVVLPDPLGPSTPSRLPFGMVMLTSWSTTRAPYPNETASARSNPDPRGDERDGRGQQRPRAGDDAETEDGLVKQRGDSFRRGHAPSPFDYANGRKGRARWPGFLTRGSTRNGNAFPCSVEHSGGRSRRGWPCGQRVGGRRSAASLLAYSGGTVWASHPLPLAAG